MKNKPVKTQITKISVNEIILRGEKIETLMKENSFAEVIYLLLQGQLPSAAQASLFNAILVSCVDHGVDAPSAHVTRTTASCGVPVQAAISAGVNAIGDYHGGAGEACAHLLQKEVQRGADLTQTAQEIVKEYELLHKRLPGLGHRVHNPDPRAAVLFKMAELLGLFGKHSQLLYEIKTAYQVQKNIILPINVDGAIAALISDLGFDWRYGKSIFIISRVAGLAAHAHEQMTTGNPLGFAQPVPIDFEG